MFLFCSCFRARSLSSLLLAQRLGLTSSIFNGSDTFLKFLLIVLLCFFFFLKQALFYGKSSLRDRKNHVIAFLCLLCCSTISSLIMHPELDATPFTVRVEARQMPSIEELKESPSFIGSLKRLLEPNLVMTHVSAQCL